MDSIQNYAAWPGLGGTDSFLHKTLAHFLPKLDIILASHASINIYTLDMYILSLERTQIIFKSKPKKYIF